MAGREASEASDLDMTENRSRKVRTTTEVGGYFSCKERDMEEDTFSPLYAAEADGGGAKGGVSE
jgi:hypothetical protein